MPLKNPRNPIVEAVAEYVELAAKSARVAIAIIVLLVIVGTAAPGYDAMAQRMDDGSPLLYPELTLKGWLP